MLRTLELAVRSLTREGKRITISLPSADFKRLTNSLDSDSLVAGRGETGGFGGDSNNYKIGDVYVKIIKLK